MLENVVEKNREDRPKTGHGSRCSKEAGMFLLAVPLQRLHVFLPLTNLSQARATVLGLSLWSINHYDSCWPAQADTLTTITGSSADWTLSMPKYLCRWHTSFHKASGRQVEPARNVHLLEPAFSWACVNWFDLPISWPPLILRANFMTTTDLAYQFADHHWFDATTSWPLIWHAKEWVNNCWWGWQNRTDLGKCTHLYDETQGTIKHERFRQRVFVRCKKRDGK